MNLYTLAGLALSLLACTCFYLASANQRWLAKAWPARPAYVAACVLIVASWFAFAQDMQRLPATYALLTMVMLGLAAPPYLAALLHGPSRREAAHGGE